MSKSTAKLVQLILLSMLCLFLVACQVEGLAEVTRLATSITSIPDEVSTVHVSTPVAPTSMASASITAIPTDTAQPTASVEPTATGTATPVSAWLINDLSNFLLYEAGRPNYKIYLSRPGNTSQLIGPGHLLRGQPWAPDGRQFAIDPRLSATQLDEEPNYVVIADLATGQTSIINLFAHSGEVYWSPNGEELLYTTPSYDVPTGNAVRPARLALYSFQEEKSWYLTETSDILLVAGWSADSQKVAFVSDMNGSYDLYVLKVADLSLQQITDTSDMEVMAIWSPSDDRLLFGTAFNYEYTLDAWPLGAESLYFVDGSGDNLIPLGDSYYVLEPSWSLDGSKIAYTNHRKLCILEVGDLSEICPLETTSPFDSHATELFYPPTWSVDGNWLAFWASATEHLCARLFVLNLATNNLTQANQGDCGAPGPAYWSRVLP